MPTYYNENDPFAAQWLRNLIAAGLIAPGDVDERDIRDVLSRDLEGYCQCHFFAGIGGWSYALRLAGWDDNQPCWTGSCPCPSFSEAGKGEGFEDRRHLWPWWFRLIREYKPDHVFGEQVAAAIRHGWIDLVSGELEREGYTVGTAVLGAHSTGAPHIRQRLYFCAQSMHAERRPVLLDGHHGRNGQDAGRQEAHGIARACSQICIGPYPTGSRCNGTVRESKGDSRDETRLRVPSTDGLTRGFWAGCDWWYGKDDKYRPIESSLFPLAYGVPNRVGRLRGYGNAIVPQVAAEFIGAYMDCCEAD